MLCIHRRLIKWRVSGALNQGTIPNGLVESLNCVELPKNCTPNTGPLHSQMYKSRTIFPQFPPITG